MNNFTIICRKWDGKQWVRTYKNVFASAADTEAGILRAFKRYAATPTGKEIITCGGTTQRHRYQIIWCPDEDVLKIWTHPYHKGNYMTQEYQDTINNEDKDSYMLLLNLKGRIERG